MTPVPYRDFAVYYDRLMAGRYVRDWWPVFRRLAARHGLQYRTVSDLAGGTGEAARRLARPGRKVYIVDRSAEMLAQARRRVPQATVLRQDLRRLRLPEPVDLAVSVFGGLNYLASVREISAVAARVRRSLRPDGVFCMDAVTPHHLSGRYGLGQETFRGWGYRSTWQYAWDPRRKCTRIRVTGSHRVGWRTWVNHRPETHVHYAYPLSALQGALRRAGFSRVESWGLPRGNAPTATNEYWLFWAQP